MDEKSLKEAKEEGRLFQLGDNFIFSVQIPDRSVGCSASRCSNCGNAVAFVHQICQACQLPLVGPIGCGIYEDWEVKTPIQRQVIAESVFRNPYHGRMGYKDIPNVPLTERELARIERLTEKEASNFMIAHGISTKHLRAILKK